MSLLYLSLCFLPCICTHTYASVFSLVLLSFPFDLLCLSLCFMFSLLRRLSSHQITRNKAVTIDLVFGSISKEANVHTYSRKKPVASLAIFVWIKTQCQLAKNEEQLQTCNSTICQLSKTSEVRKPDVRNVVLIKYKTSSYVMYETTGLVYAFLSLTLSSWYLDFRSYGFTYFKAANNCPFHFSPTI